MPSTNCSIPYFLCIVNHIHGFTPPICKQSINSGKNHTIVGIIFIISDGGSFLERAKSASAFLPREYWGRAWGGRSFPSAGFVTTGKPAFLIADSISLPREFAARRFVNRGGCVISSGVIPMTADSIARRSLDAEYFGQVQRATSSPTVRPHRRCCAIIRTRRRSCRKSY